MNRIVKQSSRMALVLLASFALLGSLGCQTVSGGVPDGAAPEVRFYAALADYDNAKLRVKAFVAAESTSAVTARKVLNIVKATDAELQIVGLDIILNGAPAGGWETAELVARVAIRRLLAEGVGLPAGGVL